MHPVQRPTLSIEDPQVDHSTPSQQGPLDVLIQGIWSSFSKIEQIHSENPKVQKLRSRISTLCYQEVHNPEEWAQKNANLQKLHGFLKSIVSDQIDRMAASTSSQPSKRPSSTKLVSPQPKRARIHKEVVYQPSVHQKPLLSYISDIHKKELSATCSAANKEVIRETQKKEYAYYQHLTLTLLAIQSFTGNSSLHPSIFSQNMEQKLQERRRLNSYNDTYVTNQKRISEGQQERMDNTLRSLMNRLRSRLDYFPTFCWQFQHNNQLKQMLLLPDGTFHIIEQDDSLTDSGLSNSDVIQIIEKEVIVID